MRFNLFKAIFKIALFIMGCTTIVFAQDETNGFKVLPLGVMGGNLESNLSAYLVAPIGSENYIALDAGTLNAGLAKAIEHKIFKGLPEEALKTHIKGYLISHPHLDHVSGLIINAPADTNKFIYGTSETLKVLQKNYFTWDAWANFTNEGEKPQLGKYVYKILEEGTVYNLAGTEMQVTSYVLSHVNPYTSTAFLVTQGDASVLYLGDTGADRLEKSDKLLALWKAVAPLITAGKLKALFLEVSFANSQPENQLFGHLTPKLFFEELAILQSLTTAKSMKNVAIVVTHTKPPIQNIQTIKKELTTNNTVGYRLIFPQQGVQFTVK